MSAVDPASHLSAPAWALCRLRRAVAWLVGLHGSPEAVAAGVAIGIFVAFTPTIGFQVVLAAFLATLLRANRAAAVIGVWTTNPLTIPPIYAFTYQVGCALWPVASSAQLSPAAQAAGSPDLAWRLLEELVAAAALGREVALPLVVGGVFVGTILAGLSYVVTVEAVRFYRRSVAGTPAGDFA